MNATVVVGAGPAGIAVGACLRRAGEEVVILEQAGTVGASWRGHYDRLHLHTDKVRSELPLLPFPESYPRYPSRDQFVEYLESYARAFDLRPKFGESVTAIEPVTDGWRVRSTTSEVISQTVVVASGYNSVPVSPTWPGLEEFEGPVLHSSAYSNGGQFVGRRVLVVGIGNSGGEIALDLCERGVFVSIAVRSPVNVIPREILGRPILSLGRMTRKLPPRISDKLTAPILKILYPDIERLGFRKHRYGPLERIAKEGRVPLIDIGTIDKIRSGGIQVRPGVKAFDGSSVTFDDDSSENYDALILATGYRSALPDLVNAVGVSFTDLGAPIDENLEIAPGLFACGFIVSAAGMLQAIRAEATAIAKTIASRRSVEVSN